ncbi:glycerol-3-phosphate 1-O-acyltransferase PlsY [Marinobacterium sp. CAU 1594]|nr:glycerol-3-phosphate 1-O-acyltransferase PlsY [Marinobacterium arenosum]
MELLGALLLLLAYLAGSLPSAILVCNSMGIADPRQQGSGNPGTSNVLRIGNRRAAGFTLLGDMTKGALAVLLARWLEQPLAVQGLCALAALLGHLYPLFADFRGGKGVATLLGTSLALCWPLGLLQLGFWLLLFLLGRIASLASIGTALITPLLSWLLVPELFDLLSLTSLLLLARHQQNIRKLIDGREFRL